VTESEGKGKRGGKGKEKYTNIKTIFELASQTA
jgi:hypothetical protein